MDRSFLSCISFQRVVQVRMPEVPNAYLYSIEAFKKEIDLDRVLIPPVIIYLEPESIDAFRRRVEKRGKVHIDFLNHEETFRVMRLWYYDLISCSYTDNNGLVLRSLENRQDLVVCQAHSFLQQANYSRERVILLTQTNDDEQNQ